MHIRLANFFTFFSAAWVHRGFSDDVTDVQTIQPGGDLLTDFQKDKFRYFFLHVLDLNSDYVISAEDFEKLNEVRMQKSECTHAQTLAVFLKYKERYFSISLVNAGKIHAKLTLFPLKTIPFIRFASLFNLFLCCGEDSLPIND